MVVYIHNDPFNKSIQFVTVDTLEEFIKLLRNNNYELDVTIEDEKNVIEIKTNKLIIN